MLLSHQLPGWKLALQGFIFFFFYKGGIGKIIWRVKMIVIQYKNCYSGLITKKSLSGEEVFFAPASLETNYY